MIDVAGPSVNSGYRTHLGAQGNTDSKLRLKSVLLFYIVVTVIQQKSNKLIFLSYLYLFKLEESDRYPKL